MMTTRGEKRASRIKKEKSAPRGGTRAGQALRLTIQKERIGLPKALKPRIRIIVRER